MEPNSLQGGIGFFDLPLEIVTKICTLCDASVPSFLLVTCRTAEAILRSNLGDTKNSFWSALLDQQFGDKWLELIDGRYGFEHNTPLWQIYFALTQRAQVDFRKETAEDPVIPYPMLSNPTEHQKNDGTIKIVVAGEIQPGKVRLSRFFASATFGRIILDTFIDILTLFYIELFDSFVFKHWNAPLQYRFSPRPPAANKTCASSLMDSSN